MKRLIAAAAALLTLTAVSAVTATASSASVCQPNGTGCTKAGTYPGPNAVINRDLGGVFKVVWTESVVQPYSSGVPLYWTVYVTYTNFSSSDQTLGCPGDWPDASFVSENMSGGSGDDGTVPAEATTCSENPGLTVTVPPGGTSVSFATFHNVPWPGSAVALTWGDVGTSPSVYPFNPGEACVFNAPKGGITVNIDGEHISGHVGWAYLADPATGIWEYGANEGFTHIYGDSSRTWLAQGKWADVISAFKGAWPAKSKNAGYYHPGKYYKTYRCVTVTNYDSSAALSVAKAQSGELYTIPDFDCLAQTVEVLATYGAPISEHEYLLNPYYWVPNHYYVSGYMSKFGPQHKL